MSNRRSWAPYLLILPAAVYLLFFFAWPMVQALRLAVWQSNSLLTVWEEAGQDSAQIGRLPLGTPLNILDQQGNHISGEEVGGSTLLTEVWFKVSGEGVEGAVVEGWSSESRIRVREQAADGTPMGGTVRPRLGAGVDPLTTLFAEPHGRSEVVGQLEAAVPVAIVELAILEVWYQIQGEVNGETVIGWAPSRYIQVFSDEVNGRVDRGNAGQFTTQFIRAMFSNRFFTPALGATLLLMVLIIPVQFVLAIVMALVVQARLKGGSLFLYIFAIPLGVSELAVGIVWFAIFTQNGLLNSILQSVGVIEGPQTYLSANSRHWIIVAIWLAEVWRATSIVMIIVVSGLQAISQEVLEAAEIFGATFWQRVRHIILPLLRPSLQVALILRTILALQVFAVVIALSGGDIVTVLARETFRQYYDLRNNNVAAAYAGLILLISMISAVLYLRLVRTQEEAMA